MPSPAEREQVQRRMKSAAEHLSLPFRARTWRGQAGSLLGVGAGSSIDFQDHRPYLPGDDPRYIDWRAYARTGHYIMKLYREEVSPLLDLVLDVSPSMFFEPAKALRVLELFAFACESGRRSGAALRAYAVGGAEVQPVEPEQFFAEPAPRSNGAGRAPELMRVPWRPGSMRVLISDLLFPGAPDPVLSALSAGRARGIVLAPFCAAESAPDWNGNLELTDCETRARRIQRVSPDLLQAYREAYRRHFSLWRERARRHAALLARVPAETGMREALQGEALLVGAVELL
jgi:uncharacterized protein (DUF58 family)